VCLRYPVSDATDIRLDRSLDGGSLMDLGCYCVHVARTLAGEPERVYAE
jgi:predicted dehydrogenase